jgi:hypothetical protein
MTLILSKPTRFVALFDCHIGWEYVNRRGKRILQKTHAEEAIRAVLRFCKDYKPQVVILGGDQLNCGPISHWHHGKPRLTEGLRLKQEMETADRILLKPLEALGCAGRKIWLDGNHEVWVKQVVEENPGLEGLVEPESFLRLRERGWEVLSQGEILTIGKLHWVHGDVVLGKGAGVNPAKTLVNAYKRNIRAGHMHTYSAAVEQTPVDRHDFHTGVVVPCLSNRQPSFVKNNPNCFINGFEFGTVFPGGSFSDYIVIINRGRFEWNGKVYDGTK